MLKEHLHDYLECKDHFEAEKVPKLIGVIFRKAIDVVEWIQEGSDERNYEFEDSPGLKIYVVLADCIFWKSADNWPFMMMVLVRMFLFVLLLLLVVLISLVVQIVKVFVVLLDSLAPIKV